MKIKKYVVNDMQEAMQLIRQDLGPDAVIVHSHKLPPRSLQELFKPRKLEVTAAADSVTGVDLALAAHQREAVSAKHRVSLPPPGGVTRTSAPRNEGGGLDVHRPGENVERVIPVHMKPAALKPLVEELDDGIKEGWFKKMLEEVLEDRPNGVNRGNLFDRWRRILLQLEVQEKLVDVLLKEGWEDFDPGRPGVGELFKVFLENRIASLLEPAYGKIERSNIYTFVGPTGVGKTLTLVKLATRRKLFENKKIALISVYSHRFGAVEKLKFYGDLIGVPVEVVMTPSELAQTVKKHEDADAVFIDTEGRSSLNAAQVLELKTFLDAIDRPQEIFLVLSLVTKNRDLMRIANNFAAVNYNRIIFTKMDETDVYGPALNVVCKTGMPVVFVTNGQNVPDDIEPVGPRKLARMIVQGVDLNEEERV